MQHRALAFAACPHSSQKKGSADDDDDPRQRHACVTYDDVDVDGEQGLSVLCESWIILLVSVDEAWLQRHERIWHDDQGPAVVERSKSAWYVNTPSTRLSRQTTRKQDHRAVSPGGGKRGQENRIESEEKGGWKEEQKEESVG